jgi:hypothetical protein
MPKWSVKDLNLVKGQAKQRQQEDRLRADAWRKEREAELEAVVNRSYDGMEFPEVRAVVAKASEVMRPLIAEFDRLVAERYPAQFARPTLGVSLTPGGIHPALRDKVRRDAAVHLAARHRYMLANSANYTTGKMSEATMHATDNPEVIEMLGELAVSNRATPVLQPPGPGIGVLRHLLPHPEEWGLEGYVDGGSPLLPPAPPWPALPAPDDDDEC